MTQAPTTDTLSGILGELRLTGALCCKGTFARPWGLRGPDADVPLFHFVYEGSCVLTQGEQEYTLEAGDLMLLPHGHGHLLYDGSCQHAVSIDALLPERGGPGVHHIAIGDGPVSMRSVCGIFFIEQRMILPFWSALPAVIHIKREELAQGGWWPGILDGLSDELEVAAPGATLMATKMSEIVFLLALRCFLSRSFAPSEGWFYALQEPRLGRAIHVIHRHYGKPWTLEQLAKKAGMSRSVFAAAFKQHTGESPISYLTITRIRQAVRMLQEGLWELKEIASMVGFRSYVGFHNAFKRIHQCTPGELREELAQEHPTHPAQLTL